MASQKYYDQVRKERISEKLNITEGQYAYIKRVGSILNDLYVNSCNGFYNEATGQENEVRARRNERLEAKYEADALKFAKDNKLEIYLQTDPRGATIYLDIKPIPDNNYTVASCIY